MTEKEKKDLGMWYKPGFDLSTRESLMRAKKLCYEFNQESPLEVERQQHYLKDLFSELGDGSFVLAPFFCDYGYNITMGKGCFLNHNVYLMDCAPIQIGNNVLIGPSTGFYTAIHAFDPNDRKFGIERAQPITVGDDVWIAGDVTVLPGVTIGSGSIIGAKTLVNKDIPENVIAAGNPVRIIRPLTEADKIDPSILEQYM